MPKICLVTLGCPKNIVEGENIAGMLRAGGWELTTDLNSADAAVIHTCSFILDAKKESEEVISNISKLKRTGILKKIAVTGCLVQSEGRKLKEKFKCADIFLGTGQLSKLPEALNKESALELSNPGGFFSSGAPRLLSSSLPSAYLRIAEGCNHKCSFCVIPKLRGKYKSRAKGEILKEARELVALGIKEINVIAQDTTYYGKDLYGKPVLAGLLRDIAGIKGIKWVRLMYAYPSTLTKDVVKVIRSEKNICKYIDIPVQHVSERVLKMMGRPGDVKTIVRHLKKEIPGLVLRTTLIVGFPGETKKEFDELAQFVSEGWFDHLGVFEYSAYGGTAACSLRGIVSARVKRERRNELMLRQKMVVAAKNKSLLGTKVDVLIESNKNNKTCSGRTAYHAPEIDGGIIVKGVCRPGRFVKAVITGYKGYDLKADL